MKNFSFYHPNHCNSYKIGMVVDFFIILSNVVHNGLMNWVLGGLGTFSFNIIMKFPLKKSKAVIRMNVVVLLLINLLTITGDSSGEAG